MLTTQLQKNRLRLYPRHRKPTGKTNSAALCATFVSLDHCCALHVISWAMHTEEVPGFHKHWKPETGLRLEFSRLGMWRLPMFEKA